MTRRDDSQSGANSVASLKKWGIPHQQTPEIALLERLVWVKYKSRWWPALLYYSYSELQNHLYDQLDMVLKAQFAMAIMRQMQERREIKVARLLGKAILEIVEVAEDGFCEFYWQLPNILPRACLLSHYDGDMEMYYDFHRALDEVEDIIREVSQENFALLPDAENLSWLERAQMAVEKGDDSSSVKKGKSRTDKLKKAAQGLISQPKWMTEDNGPNEIRATSSLTSNNSKASSSSKGVSMAPAGPTPSSISVGPTPSTISVGPTPSTLSSSNSIRDAPSEAKSKRSTKTKASQAVTEVVDNRAIQVDPPQEAPSLQKENSNPAVDTVPSETVPVTKTASIQEESREPQEQEQTTDTTTTTTVDEKRVITPFEVVPGLEGDDIVPGLSARVSGARSTLKNVLGFMSGSREEGIPTNYGPGKDVNLSKSIDFPSRPPSFVNGSSLPQVTNKEMRNVVSPDDTPYIDKSDANPTTKQPLLSFWQRMTCYSTDF